MNAWLAAAYGVLALGLAWSLTGTGSWGRRAAYIVCAPPLALALWIGRPDPAGWPSTANLPPRAQLVWAEIDEPDPTVSDPGHIYLWLDVGGTAPRAFALAYTRRLHEQVQRALQAVKHGRPMAVERTVSAGGHGRPTPGHPSELHFYLHPPIVLPPKARS